MDFPWFRWSQRIKQTNAEYAKEDERQRKIILDKLVALNMEKGNDEIDINARLLAKELNCLVGDINYYLANLVEDGYLKRIGKNKIKFTKKMKST